MQLIRMPMEHPQLRELVVEASRALATLDAGRLEELALCCQALNRDCDGASAARKRELRRQATEAQRDMAVFGRVLEATRSNMKVMNRLREMRMGRLEYAQPSVGWRLAEKGHGDN